ncbi:hypothetical protein [Pedobacter antarcticus]|uniref:hypothetical protein n=1 Tax=Pedobacter antarcticus TaxID=34086 RepID=UPI00088A2C30|nr:hypothetical protein [Pedobacter antarcticus]SDL70122.1 hypothetical protein SAMN04488084_102165 [Pedobacter antarcticus]
MEEKPAGLFANKRFRNKLIIIIVGILLFYLAIFISSKNGWIDSMIEKKVEIGKD